MNHTGLTQRNDLNHKAVIISLTCLSERERCPTFFSSTLIRQVHNAAALWESVQSQCNAVIQEVLRSFP